MNIFFKSVRFAWHGIQFAFMGRNFRIQFVIAILVGVAGVAAGLNDIEWSIILITIGLVLSIEMINSAIEHIVNMVSPEFHPIAGKVKDLAAGAVLVLSIIATIIGILIFKDYVILFLDYDL